MFSLIFKDKVCLNILLFSLLFCLNQPVKGEDGRPAPAILDNDTARCESMYGSHLTVCLIHYGFDPDRPVETVETEGTIGYPVPFNGCSPGDQDMGDGCCLKVKVSDVCEQLRKLIKDSEADFKHSIELSKGP